MDQDVFEFEISVDNTMTMEVRDGLRNLSNVKRRPMLVEAPPVLLQGYVHVRVQRAAGTIRYDQDKLVPFLEGVI